MKAIVKTNRPKIAPSAHTSALLAAPGKHTENGGIEWDVANASILTSKEVEALKRKHKSPSPNLQRATEVKRFMQQGKRRIDIVMLLRRKYKERMISADHAALSEVGEGVKK